MTRTSRLAALYILMAFAASEAAPALADGTIEFAYGGRITEANGKPVEGDVALKIAFFHDKEGQTEILSVTSGLEKIALVQGIFQFRLPLPVADYNKVFNSVDQPVWIQVTDLTHPQKGPFPLQQVMVMPYASKVPVDGTTLSFNNDGKLTVGPSGAPGANQFISKDAQGGLIWGTPNTSAAALQGQGVSAIAPTTDQVLKFDGTQWLPTTMTSGTLTAVTATAPLATSGSATAPALSITQASSVSNGFVSSADWITFNSKQADLGFTPVNKAGDTMAGVLNLPANGLVAGTNQFVLSGGNVGIGTTNPQAILHVNGDLIAGNKNVRSFTRTLPIVVGDAVDIGSVTFTQGAAMLSVSFMVGSPSFGVSKLYTLACQYGATGGAWVAAMPLSSTGAHSGDDVDLDININAYVVSLRMRRTQGTNPGVAYITIDQTGVVGDTFTPSTATSTVSTPTIVLGSATLTQVGGKVGIGTSSPNGILHIAGTTTIHGAGEGATPSAATIRGANGTGADISGANLTFAASNGTGTGGSGSLLFQTAPAAATSSTANTLATRMTIAKTGDVGIGTTSPAGLLDVQASSTGGTYAAYFYNNGNTTSSNGVAIRAGNSAAGGANVLLFQRGSDGTTIGSVSHATASTVAYNTTSDRRLKENIVDSTLGVDVLSRIRVRDYNYISDGEKLTLQGFIAQELYDVYPQAVTVGGDDPKTNPWQVDYGKLTPLLVKSVQDLQSENAQLKARADKGEADSMAKDDAIARLRAEKNAEIGQLKAFLCSQFPTAPMCHP